MMKEEKKKELRAIRYEARSGGALIFQLLGFGPFGVYDTPSLLTPTVRINQRWRGFDLEV